MIIAELYDKNSTFTLTCNYKQLDRYMRFARNIIGDGNLSQIASQVYHGRDELMKVFQLMPKVAYDLLSFTTDAIVFNVSECVVIILIYHSDRSY